MAKISDMPRVIYLDTPAGFSFVHTVQSHGWYDLPPYDLDEKNVRLIYVFRDPKTGKAGTGTLNAERGKVRIEMADGRMKNDSAILRDVKHLLRLDDDLGGFYESISTEERLSWVSAKGAGRLMRSPTVFEDLVKTICTTNCSWSLTRIMVRNLVDKLGDAAADGRKAFPTAHAMAERDEKFYRDEIRAGYRSPYFAELAAAVASGERDPESWVHSNLPTPELKKEIKSVKGVGDYAAELMLRLVGRYDGLALDSWVRGQFYKKHNRDKRCDDKKIEKFYKRFGDWRGLALWCDMTEEWFG